MSSPFPGAPMPDPAALSAKLDEIQRQAEAVLGRFGSLMGEEQEHAFEGRSADQQAYASVDVTGRITEIDVTDVLLYDLAAAGPAILEAVNRAKLAHSVAMTDLVGKLDGGMFNIADRLNEALPQDTRELHKYHRGEY